MTNNELRTRIQAVSAGDRTAFEEIYKELNKPMYTIILRITQEQSLSEDILQEIFVKLFQSPPITANNPRAYLFQMARNLAIDGIRKRPQFANVDDFENLVYSPDIDISEKLAVEEALKTLPLIECQIVSLHINGSLTIKEISKILDMPIGTTLWRYHKAIKQLRLHLTGGAI
ncbi:MAG: RNA polymerase sigma factor [Clostridiales bacterium]|jgi:RNA polymerase sigma-70 factor (ECF subfamily)|nr:RNA polymerase sigma factor [Clostridiales bacterium]